MKKQILLLFAILLMGGIASAQELNVDELKAQIAEKSATLAKHQAKIDALKAEIAGIQKEIDLASGWRFNTGGIIGFSLAGFQNWSKQSNPNSKVSDIKGLFNGAALLDKPKYFWRNEGQINVAWQQLVLNDKEATDEQKKYQNVADIFTLTSLFGYKITQDIAISALGQYNSSIVHNFNNPGILDLGVGATWTPHQVPNFVLTVHPLNYHMVFQKGDVETKSALGAKVFASYFTNLYKGVKWTTNLNGFLEYGKSTPSLNEYTWINTLSLPAWHGIGIGIGFGLRNSALESPDLQSYYNVGLSYSL